ncbi:glycosyltransferase family 4 protein [Vibrio owensii]|uniref:glycosyltransferase family 4 protein n=1 Tax=Vibrio owensii TaxID=696485 RepID=UPI0022DDFA42|nr:glycosyltransferase family 4 protein [Vibrio owensii]MDA0382590.1 glycosyltransferase family 4 protein [Vibrio owensii]
MKLISNNLEIPVVGEVWILLDSRIYGGIESHVVELATGLQSFHVNVRVVLVVEYDPPAPLIDKLNQAQIPVSYLWHLCPKSERSKTIPVKQITGAVAEHQPSVIHTHGYKAALLARSAKLFTRTFPRLISTYHAGETPTGKVWAYDWLDRYSARLSDHSFAVSQAIQDKLPTQSELLNNFVTIPEQLCRYKEIAFVGRLSHEKGADRFIDIARQIPDIEFSIYGDGPEKPRLVESAPTNVIFHGHQSDMDAVWRNISVLIISSRYEGLPMAALEAMVRGIVVISLDVGRLPDLIQDGQNGFLAHDIPALTDKINRWLEMSHSEQYPMRHKAIETIKAHYSSRSIIPILIERYQIENHT